MVLALAAVASPARAENAISNQTQSAPFSLFDLPQLLVNALLKEVEKQVLGPIGLFAANPTDTRNSVLDWIHEALTEDFKISGYAFIEPLHRRMLMFTAFLYGIVIIYLLTKAPIHATVYGDALISDKVYLLATTILLSTFTIFFTQLVLDFFTAITKLLLSDITTQEWSALAIATQFNVFLSIFFGFLTIAVLFWLLIRKVVIILFVIVAPLVFLGLNFEWISHFSKIIIYRTGIVIATQFVQALIFKVGILMMSWGVSNLDISLALLSTAVMFCAAIVPYTMLKVQVPIMSVIVKLGSALKFL